MLHYTDTTVFNAGARALVNTVNCVGVMGNGLALECRLRYPEMFRDYVERCQRGEVRIGKPYVYQQSSEPAIINFPAKVHWKYPSRLEWIHRGLEGVRALLTESGISSLAVPPVGCDLGKLEWDDVHPLMRQYLGDLDIEIFICFDREKCASGIEGRMVEMLNDVDNPFWADLLGVKGKAAADLRAALPVRHFREVRHLPGIGKQGYERLFKMLYSRAGGSRGRSEMQLQCSA